MVRFRVIASAGASVPPPEELALFDGELGSAHLRQIERDDLSKALSERRIPSLTWAEDGAVVLAPTGMLGADADLTLVAGRPPTSWAVHVAPSDTLPVLVRTWPPADEAATGALAVHCLEAADALALAEAGPTRIELDPGRVPAVLSTGAADGGGPACIRLALEAESPAAVLPPALVEVHGSPYRLEPIPIARVADVPPVAPPLQCTAAELPMLAGCARMADDRAALRTPEAPLLWVVRGTPLDPKGPAFDWVGVSSGGTITVRGLPADTSLELDVTSIDVAGVEEHVALGVHTLAPMAHPILNEVLANPLGAEPEQEWIELFNDGIAPAHLGGYSLDDVGGSTVLPEVVLGPGAFALLVGESFQPDDGFDTPVAPGIALVEVPELGTHGLANSGEPLVLRGPHGQIVSSFPPLPKPKAGRSVVRVAPGAPDGDPASFALCDGQPTPGAPNVPLPP